MLLRVLTLLHDADLQRLINRQLGRHDILVTSLPAGSDPWSALSSEVFDLLIMAEGALRQPPEEIAQHLRSLPEMPWLALLTDRDDGQAKADLRAAGCVAVVWKQLEPGRIVDVLRQVLDERLAFVRQSQPHRQALQDPHLGDFVSESPAMQEFMRLVHKVANSESTLLVLGETGVGKERLARAIHAESPRGAGPFVAINCGALPENLLESELFGHESGAFTGATRAHRGCFELAHGGTLLLDEIGELPYHLQVKLLRVLQEKKILRVGGEKMVSVDVRVMAATNSQLAEAVKARTFRQDLFYRLGVVTLEVPPLRSRIEDVNRLVSRYIDFLNRTMGSTVSGIAPEAMEALKRYDWPGNIRELCNVIERAMLICEDSLISPNDLPLAISALAPPGQAACSRSLPAAAEALDRFPHSWLQRPWRDFRQAALEEAEAWYFRHLLQDTGGRINETARRADVDPRSVNEKMRKYGFDKKRFREPRA